MSADEPNEAEQRRETEREGEPIEGEGGDAPLVFPKDDDAVPIALLPSAILAHIVASILRESGVHAVVVGEHSAGAFGPAVTATSISVLVPRSKYEDGIAVLHGMMEERIAQLKAAKTRKCLVCGYDMAGLEEQDRCPECGTKLSQLLELSRVMTIVPPRPPQSPMVRMMSMIGCLVFAVIAVAFLSWLFAAMFLGSRHGR